MPLSGILGEFETLQKYFWSQGKNRENIGNFAENIRKIDIIEISVEISYRFPLITEISQIFQSKFQKFCSMLICQN